MTTQVAHKIVLHFPQQTWDRPIVCRLAKEFDLCFSITKAEITHEEEGLVVLDLSGPESEYRKGVKFLKEEGVRVESLERDVTRNEAKCTHCGACLAVCPTEALDVDRTSWVVSFDPAKCIACEMCIRACPPHAMQTAL
jgi:ferredoxin